MSAHLQCRFVVVGRHGARIVNHRAEVVILRENPDEDARYVTCRYPEFTPRPGT
jgi:hypothetical protein